MAAGTVTPVSNAGAPIVPAQTSYVPLPRTLLPLPRYAEMMGINPIQFMSGIDTSLFPTTGCTDRWLTYPWQNSDRVSRYELAVEIRQAEREIAAQLGWWPAPAWTEDDEQMFPKHYRQGTYGLYGLKPSGHAKTVSLKWGHFIQGGRRAITYIVTPTVAGGDLVYSDESGDGILDTATLTFLTTVTDTTELAVFYSGYNGDEAYEIRPARQKAIAGGIATLTFDIWLFFDLDLLSAFPGSDGFSWLTLEGPNMEDAVDVYRVYADEAESATLYWERHPRTDGSNTYGNLSSQSAALSMRNELESLVVPLPGTYDAATDAWTAVAYTANREPDRLVANYYAGLRERRDRAGDWTLPDDLAWAVVNMATARLARPLCTQCESVKVREKEMREDLIFVTRSDQSETRFVTREVMNNPFGTRRGEVVAWRAVQGRLKNGEKHAAIAPVL